MSEKPLPSAGLCAIIRCRWTVTAIIHFTAGRRSHIAKGDFDIMMNKKELVASVMAKLEGQGFPVASKAQAQRAVAAVLETIKESVVDGDGVNIIGFGSFRPAERKATQFRNMQTGELMDVPARRVVTFKPGKAFKDAVNKQ